MIKESLIKKKFTIKSITNSHRNYSSIKNFCVFIKKLIDNYNYLKFNKNVFKINFASDKNLSLIDLVKIVKKKLKLKKNNFIFKYKKLKRAKIINYSSNYFSVFYSRNDKFFNSEIKNTISYIKQNYKIK